MLLATLLDSTLDLKKEIDRGDSAQLKDFALAEALNAEIMDCARARAVMGGLGKVVERWYNFPEFGGYLGNVGSIVYAGNLWIRKAGKRQ